MVIAVTHDDLPLRYQWLDDSSPLGLYHITKVGCLLANKFSHTKEGHHMMASTDANRPVIGFNLGRKFGGQSLGHRSRAIWGRITAPIQGCL